MVVEQNSAPARATSWRSGTFSGGLGGDAARRLVDAFLECPAEFFVVCSVLITAFYLVRGNVNLVCVCVSV